MKRSTAAAALIALAGALLAAPAPARAVGVGIYGTVGGGVLDWDGTGSGQYDHRMDMIHSGGGVVLDTGSPYHPLGYRLAIGWERIADNEGGLQPGYTMEGVVVDQDLTVDLIRGGGALRVWAGPELRLGFLKGSPDGVPGPDDNIFAVGIGPVVGFDVGVSPGLAITWKLGYLVTGYAGEDGSSSEYRYDDTLDGGHAFVTLAVMFRTWSGEREQPPRYDRPPRRW